MAQRIKGQEIAVTFTGPDGLEEGLVDCKSFDWTVKLATLEEGYLGEVANRYDDIYNGCTGTAEFHLETGKFLAFQARVQDRAQRRSPAASVFNVVASFDFPDGERPRVVFEDVFWGEMPVKTSSRSDYVTTTVEWSCSLVRRIA